MDAFIKEGECGPILEIEEKMSISLALEGLLFFLV